jgi:hypothetical protein
MNISFLRKVGLAAVLICARFAQAGPSELNYQGVVLDSSGNGVSGTRAMTLKLYDAAIGGNLLYTENLGNVALNKGVYSFNFGTNGTGNPKITETVTVADGTSTTFQKILANTNVVAGSVSVTDGTYTWDQMNGSSDGGVSFDASYSTSLKRITVNYYTGAPVSGKTISVTYRSPSAGLDSVFASENTSWIEITLAGVAQSPRQKLLSVPYAVKASRIEESGYQETTTLDLPIQRFVTSNSRYGLSVGSKLPISVNNYPWNSGTWNSMTIFYDIPFYIKEISSLFINYSVQKYSSGSYTTYGRIDYNLLDSNDQSIAAFSFPRSEVTSSNVVIPVNKTIPSGGGYRISITIQPGNDNDYNGNAPTYGGGSINSLTIKGKVLKSMGFQ